MGIKKGDKFIIEITEETEQWAGYYFVSNNTTYFHISEEELECLERYDETEAYKKGLNDAWEAAREICAGRFAGKIDTGHILNFTATEALDKIKAYEEEQSKIKVGDEVKVENSGGYLGKAIVTYVDKYEKEIYVVFAGGSAGEITDGTRLRKTGRHFDEVEKLIEVLKGGDNSEQISF